MQSAQPASRQDQDEPAEAFGAASGSHQSLKAEWRQETLHSGLAASTRSHASGSTSEQLCGRELTRRIKACGSWQQLEVRMHPRVAAPPVSHDSGALFTSDTFDKCDPAVPALGTLLTLRSSPRLRCKQALLQRNAQHMNTIHVSALVTQLAKTHPPSPAARAAAARASSSSQEEIRNDAAKPHSSWATSSATSSWGHAANSGDLRDGVRFASSGDCRAKTSSAASRAECAAFDRFLGQLSNLVLLRCVGSWWV